jgi:2-hydroxychromene-2-carboxylate isomerase
VDVASREQARVIRLWIDYVSPYAFVAKAGAYALAADYDIELEWRPYTLDVSSFMGAVEQRDPHHWRRVRYSYMDARRFANKQGLILKGPTRIFYARPANAAMLYAQKHGAFRAYNDLAFERFWRRELDPENVDAVSALLAEVGAPPGFAAFLAGEGGADHDRLRGEAEAAGVFGVPTFVFDGELFWGGDRIGLLRERLDEKGVKRRPGRGPGRG